MAANAHATGGPIRRSLVDSTAEAFRRATTTGPPALPAVATGAGAFAALSGAAETVPVIRRSLTGLASSARTTWDDDGPAAIDRDTTFDVSTMPARDFQRLVDAIVEAIEQRVVDELERRGRRHPGVF